jgi:hypothetical protein
LSGLVVLADYANEHADSNTVVRFASGCGQLVSWPLAEAASERPHAVLGLFDASARPMVPRDVLSYAVPLGLLLEMEANLDESFLRTPTWEAVRRRA